MVERILRSRVFLSTTTIYTYSASTTVYRSPFSVRLTVVNKLPIYAWPRPCSSSPLGSAMVRPIRIALKVRGVAEMKNARMGRDTKKLALATGSKRAAILGTQRKYRACRAQRRLSRMKRNAELCLLYPDELPGTARLGPHGNARFTSGIPPEADASRSPQGPLKPLRGQR